MESTGGDRDDQALKARLAALAGGLERQRALSQSENLDAGGVSAGRSGRALSVGLRVLSEFVAAVAVGALIGWQIDSWFGTQPGGLVVFLMLGTAAGFWNVYRIAAASQSGTGDGDASAS